MGRPAQEHWNKIYSSSLEMIERCAINKNDPILDVGAGATTLVDFLIKQTYRSIIALDISEVAQEKLRNRLGYKRASPVQWLIDDITKPTTVLDFKEIAIWHDRALLHFLIEDEQRQAHLSVLKKVVKKESIEYEYQMPSGPIRPYVYGRFQKMKSRLAPIPGLTLTRLSLRSHLCVGATIYPC